MSNFWGAVHLGTLYMASLAKAAVSNQFKDKSSEAMSTNARKIFLNYCSNPENNVKLNKAIKKALKEK